MTEEKAIETAEKVLSMNMQKKAPQLWVARVNGEIIKLPSGKSSWKQRGHAKSAVTNALYRYFKKYRDGYSPGQVTQLLVDARILTFERLD